MFACKPVIATGGQQDRFVASLTFNCELTLYCNRKSEFIPDPKHDAGQEKATPEFSYSRKLAFLSKVIRHPDMTLAGARAADVVVEMHNHRLGYCWPSLDTMSERMGVARSTAKAAVALLVKLGFLVKETVREKGHQGSNRYRPVLDTMTPSGRSTGPSQTTSGRSVAPQGPNPDPARGRIPIPPEADPSPPNQDEGTRSNNQAEDNQLASREAGFPLDQEVPAKVAAKPVNVPLPADLAFPPEAVAAARARGLDDADVAAALSAFRQANANDQRTHAAWVKGAAGWLGRQNPRPPGTAARIVPERPADPSDPDGELFSGFDNTDERLRERLMAMPDRVFQASHRAFLDRYGAGGDGEAAMSRCWNEAWLAWTQYDWDMDKLNRSRSKFTPPRPGI